ncbi:MAG: CHAD domain-containing protein [Steroidobacteraceae bacterium]
MKPPPSAREPAPDADHGADALKPAGRVVSLAAHSRADACTEVREIALAELQRLSAEWLAHEPGARLGHDPEELHQLRVTARRTGAMLGLYQHHLPAALVRARKTAKNLLRALGSARDLDVQLAGLADYCLELPPDERAALAPLTERLTLDRARARTRMLRALDSGPTRRWIQTLARAGAQAPAGNGAPGAAGAASPVPQQVRRRFRRLRKAVRRLCGSSSMEDYHKVRRRAKQLRYVLESGALTYGKPVEEMLKALRRMQDKLGAQQDAHLARSRLTALAADPACALPPATLFLMGRLAEHHLRVTARARATLARSWRKVSGRRWRTLRAQLGELDRPAPRAAEPFIDAAERAAPPGAGQSPLPAPEISPLSH